MKAASKLSPTSFQITHHHSRILTPRVPAGTVNSGRAVTRESGLLNPTTHSADGSSSVFVPNCFFFLSAILVVMPCVLLPIFWLPSTSSVLLAMHRETPAMTSPEISLPSVPGLRSCGVKGTTQEKPVALPPIHSIH